MPYKSWVTVLQLQFFSVVLQGFADSESRFISIDIGAYGKEGDDAVWLTVHRSSMWNKKPTRCHLVLYLVLLYKLLNMFRAILCPSSGAD